MTKEQEKEIKVRLLQELQEAMGKHAISSIYPKSVDVPSEDMSEDDVEDDEDEDDTDVSRLRRQMSKGE